ncbi:MAG: TonB-dependent receptor domain-containing protein [Bryobacteraceae bacterium]
MRLRILLCFILLGSFSLFAQQDRGTLTGTVSDPAGAVVASVKVTITNTATNATYETATNNAGQFTMPNLPVGPYRIQYEAAGFRQLVRDGINLGIAQVIRADAVLQLGSTTESIEVTAEVPLLQTDTPEVGTSLDNRRVVDMPLGFSGGRYAENFAYRLTPGVAGNNWTSRINGSPAFAKEVVLDGASATIYIGGHMGESSPSMEALEEFRVQTSGMSAEFGRTGGGIFNFVMKSGTNQVHGSAMGQIHNEWMDANTFANNYFGRPRQLDRRHNYAFSGGGPLYIPKVYDGRNKTFFYLSYERYNEAYAGGGSPTVTAPLPEFWNGDLSRLLTNERIGTDALGRPVLRGTIYDPRTTRFVDGQLVRDPFPNNQIPASMISNVARNLGNIFTRHYNPTVTDGTGQIALLNNAFFPIANQAGFTQDQLSVKMDQQVSSAHRINGSYVWVDRPRYLLDQGGVWDFNDRFGGPLSRLRLQQVESWYGRMAWNWVASPTIMNHMQLGFNRQRNPSTSVHTGINGVEALGLRGYDRTYNFPQISFGNNDRVNFPLLGYQANNLLAAQNFQFINTLSWIKNRHSMRMGIDWRRSYMRSRDNAGPGAINFSQAQTGLPGFNQTGHGFASMLLGDVASSSVLIDTPTGSRYLSMAMFFQDDFRVSRTLTLNLGVRWDYQPLPVEHYNRYPNWNPTLVDPLWGFPGAMEYASESRRNFADSSRRHFSPRFGFAWQAADKLAIRGAYGIFFHGRSPNGWSGNPWGNKIGFQSINQVNSPTGYGPAFNWDNGYPGVVQAIAPTPSLAAPPVNAWGPVNWDPAGGRVGYTQQWNFNIQRELPGNLVFDIGYVGSKSTATQANELRQLNQLDPRHLAIGDPLAVWINNDASVPAAIRAAGGRYPYGDLGEWIPAWQTLAPFPHLIYWSNIYSAFSPLGFGTYHALQVQVNKRFSSGLQFLSNYTFSRTMDNLDSAFGDTWGMNAGRPMNYYDLSLDKSVSQSDRTHWIKIGGSYDLPLGRGRRFGNDLHRAANFAVGGWTIQYIGNYSSGEPVGFTGTPTAAGNFQTQRAMLVNPEGRPLSLNWNRSNLDFSRISTPGHGAHRYFDTSLLRNPDRFERGTSAFRYSQLRMPWYYGTDFSLQKNFFPAEGVRIQFRVESLNALNMRRINGVNTSAASPLFGQVTSISNDRRQFQFGIRADW